MTSLHGYTFINNLLYDVMYSNILTETVLIQNVWVTPCSWFLWGSLLGHYSTVCTVYQRSSTQLCCDTPLSQSASDYVVLLAVFFIVLVVAVTKMHVDSFLVAYLKTNNRRCQATTCHSLLESNRWPSYTYVDNRTYSNV